MDQDYSTPFDDRDLSTIAPVRAPFGYYGAKQRIVRHIINHLPPHNAWVEAFCGSAAVTLAKQAAPIEVINDRDGEIVNLFKQLRDRPNALCRAIALTPYARAELELTRNHQQAKNSLERARRFLVATMMSINGTINGASSGFSFSQSYTRENKEARVNRWYNLPERLERVVDRLRTVRIENRDARELLLMFADRPATLMYLDPPYYTKRYPGYAVDANDIGFHKELLAICKKAKCMLLVSGYENDLYNTLLCRENGWEKVRIETSTRDTKGTDYSRTEILWMNRLYLRALTTGRVPIRLSAKEKSERKINPSRKG